MLTPERSDCGCWTDVNGYWRLSKKCHEAELAAWRQAMGNAQHFIEDLRAGRIGMSEHERAVAYFRQELRNHVE